MRRTAEDGNDQGFTLIELIVYSALLTVVLGLVGTLLITSLTNEKTVRESSAAANEAQLVAQVIGGSTRGASAISAPTSTRPLLVMQTTTPGGAGGSVCQAFYYSAADKSIRMKQSSSAISTTTAPADWQTWTVLARGVTPTGSSQIFTTSGRQVALRFTVAVNDRPDQVVDTFFSTRYPSPKAACFA